jgi:hypothetical protein
MKKIIFTIAVMLATIMQAQTCKISSANGRRVVHISVNLDDLEGKTLVTTVKNVHKDSVVLDMAFEGGAEEIVPVTKIPREDSSENTAQNNEIEVEPVELASKEQASDSINVEPAENATHSDSAEVASTAEMPQDSSITGGVLNALGLAEVGNLIGALTNTNGEEVDKMVTKALVDVTVVDSTKYIPQYPKRKWKWPSYTRLSLSGIFGQDFGGDDNEGVEEIDSENYGTDPENSKNFGGSAEISQVFLKGRYDEDGKFIPNPLNFAWSVGALFAMDHQKDFGWSWDLLAKFGIQAGKGLTLGADALIGGGGTKYAIYSTNGVDYRVVYHDQWCFKAGVQGWISMNDDGTTSTRLFARIVKSFEPSSIHNTPTAPGWKNVYVDFDDGSWQVGFAVDYKFGFKPKLEDKRLLASVSTGYNLFGADKGLVMLYELEKVTQISPMLRFMYGLGYEQSLSGEQLQSFTLGGGWLFKLKPKQKFSYLAKVFAGLGEYMVDKNCISENKDFKMADTKVRQLCPKIGVHLGIAYQTKCSTFTLGLRGAFHKGLDTEYEGYETAETTNLSGFELTPMFGYSLNF